MVIMGIYRIVNTITAQSYVGSSVNLNRRYYDHWGDLLKDKHCNRKLQASWNKYTRSAFIFEILELVFDKSELIEREQIYIDTLHAYSLGLNAKPLAGSNLGMRMPESSKKRLREINLGKKQTAELIKKRTCHQIGKKQSPETVAKRVATRKEQGTYRCSESTKQLLRNLHLGKPRGKKI